MTKKEFIDNYIDFKLLNIIFDLGPDADIVEDDKLNAIIRESCERALDDYSDGDEVIDNAVNYGNLYEDMMCLIREKIGD